MEYEANYFSAVWGLLPARRDIVAFIFLVLR
jgi:hypothetical protein